MEKYDYFVEEEEKKKAAPMILLAVWIISIIMFIIKVILKDNVYDVLVLCFGVEFVEQVIAYKKFRHKEDLVASLALGVLCIIFIVLYVGSSLGLK